MTRLLLAALVGSFFATPMVAQLTAGASIAITARVPSSVTLSLRTIPVAIEVSDRSQQTFSVPLLLKWNVDPHEIRGFEVVAYFGDPQVAMTESATATSIAASDIFARWLSDDYLPFASGGKLSLFQIFVLPDIRLGQRENPLELRIADQALPHLPPGSYQGVLNVEVRQF